MPPGIKVDLWRGLLSVRMSVACFLGEVPPWLLQAMVQGFLHQLTLDVAADEEMRRLTAADGGANLRGIYGVTLGKEVTNAGTLYLGFLPTLESLSLTESAVTDAGLSALRGLTSLQTLLLPDRIGHVQVTSEVPEDAVLAVAGHDMAG